ncbi:uncharacterized protein LOC142342441 isoform X2 [Convolutriloba macropyga]|uniref:uncharacterized protein LOC142342441 isoform X2 n=1 Tax=Convolutriloba macropyga TaxID=536237 RepID=UPI003F528CC6
MYLELISAQSSSVLLSVNRIPGIRNTPVKPEDVSLVSVATAIHWLDFDRLASQIVQIFPNDTTTAIVGYLSPAFMTQSTLKKKNHYDENLEHYNQVYDTLIRHTLRKFMNFDYECMIAEYHPLPFHKFFGHHKFHRFHLIQQATLVDLVEFIRTTSCYQLLRSENLDQIESGKMKDPLEEFVSEVLRMEGLVAKDVKLCGIEESDEITELMKSVEIDTIWTFFVHLLRK